MDDVPKQKCLPFIAYIGIVAVARNLGEFPLP